MRNITFAGLIILVGFVAALPFKKTPPAGPAESESTLATGPSTGLAVTDESVSFEQLVVNPQRQPLNPERQQREIAPWDQPVRSSAAPRGELVSNSSTPRPPKRIPSDAGVRPRRDLRMPLTYDDLAVPLATPHYIDERYQAVAKPDSRNPRSLATGSAYQSMRFASEEPGSAQSPYEQFDRQPQSIIAEATESSPPARTSSTQPVEVKVEGKLVSDMSRQAKQTKPAPRVRHWIRQPD